MGKCLHNVRKKNVAMWDFGYGAAGLWALVVTAGAFDAASVVAGRVVWRWMAVAALPLLGLWGVERGCAWLRCRRGR